MKLQLSDDLPFVAVQVSYQGRNLEIPSVLVDTGSASTMFAADMAAQIGIIPELEDTLHTIRGVGGAEVVFTRQTDQLRVGQQGLKRFDIEVGGMDYGFEINGILGMDFLVRTGAVIDLRELELRFSKGITG